MNPRTTAVLLAVALALGAFVYFYEIEGEEARLEREERAKQLFPEVEASDVAWLELRTSDGVPARFERHEGRWRLVRPLDFPADPAVERFADTLASVTSESVFDDPQPPEEYGLDEASATVVRFGAGGAEHELRFGAPTPVGSATYAAIGGSEAVYAVESFRASGFDRSLTELRDKQVLDFDREAIREIALRWPGARVALRHNEEGGPGTWRMTAPLETRADDAAVSDLLASLGFLRAVDFVDAPSPEQEALLDPPALAVQLAPHGEDGEPLELVIGGEDEEGRRLARAGGDTLFVVPGERLADFAREVVAYRDRTLAAFELSRARRVDFFFRPPVGDPVAISATLEDGTWSSTPEPFARGELPRLVSELSRLDADDVLAESMGEAELEELGLSPPATILSVFGARPGAEAAEADAEEGELAPAPRLAEIHLGRLTRDGVPARRPDDPVVYRLAPERAEHLPVDLAAFRARFRAEEPREEQEPLPGAEPGTAEELPSPRAESP